MFKKWMVIALSCGILGGTALVVKPEAVSACSCAMAPSPAKQVEEELNHKTVIFTGKAIKVTQPKQRKFMSSTDQVEIIFEVSTSWKDKLGNQAAVYTAMSSASCGFENFREGTEYIVSAYERSGKLETNICDLTKPLASAGEELKLLGTGYSPSPASSQKYAPDSDRSLASLMGISAAAYAALAAGIFLIAGFGVFLFRRSRR
ncbi:hypothetical protein [Paenibacillus nasutitermitis]|uniref:Tissue inhibitor of metalloproteinase n=1 Tax=Paenibacillus nasutitermitis TaxID=1652958 RepID=A0A916YSJ6_9BACL|nr:hypothetical protein [Paenibacillus nasutitermitis]GGD57890.1 hypothetical protein GCM10010911_14610 [Paenibacillus nasutitermitis]